VGFFATGPKTVMTDPTKMLVILTPIPTRHQLVIQTFVSFPTASAQRTELKFPEVFAKLVLLDLIAKMSPK